MIGKAKELDCRKSGKREYFFACSIFLGEGCWFQVGVLVSIICLISPAKGLGDTESPYDFIIAGGGTAGLAVARRLAEGGKHSVLVLESGDMPKEGMDVPVYVPRFVSDSDVTFRYTSLPQRNAGLINENGVITEVTGRVLSGSSNLNYMWINRGNPRDYDNWGNLTQDSGWNYANMLKYFKRMETYVGDFPSDQHGFHGPIMVSRPKYAPGVKFWLAAGKSLGYPVADANGPQQVSFSPVEYSKRFGRRDSAFTGYIQPILETTPNLHIILNTNVTKIIFHGNRAVGVEFKSQSPELSHQKDNCLYANKEIIASAGAFGSPLLLMRSGIGPKSALRAAKIPLVRDLPVGKNYQNHVAVPLHIVHNNRHAVMDEDRDLTPETWKYFEQFGDGPYSSTLGTLAQAFVVSTVAKSDGESNWPDLHFTLASSVQAFHASGVMSGNHSIAPWEGPMTGTVYMTRPKSRGSITLNPRDPTGPPMWDVGYLSDERDTQKILDGVKLLLKIFEETPVYRKLGAYLPPANIPSCKKYRYRSEDYWRCYIRYVSRTGYHPAGTCKMGRGPDDHEAVVDPKLRVIGVQGLRVVDASIMPAVTNANTQTPVYGIAEKAADMILNDW